MNWKDLEKNLSPDVLMLSAESIGAAKKELRAELADEYHKLDRLAKQSALEETFLLLWNEITGNAPLVREYRFHPTRKWRADFCHEESKSLIEIEGGTRKGGRHNRAEGYARDGEKYNAAQALGYKVYRLTDVNLNYDNVQTIAELVTKGTG